MRTRLDVCATGPKMVQKLNGSRWQAGSAFVRRYLDTLDTPSLHIRFHLMFDTSSSPSYFANSLPQIEVIRGLLMVYSVKEPCVCTKQTNRRNKTNKRRKLMHGLDSGQPHVLPNDLAG